MKWKLNPETVIMDRAWWDFDIVEGGTLDDVKKDVAVLLNKLKGDVRLVFTGRGFHIHQLFEKNVIGTTIAKHIDRYEREVSKGLKTLDGVGHPLKLTRIPDTYNTTRKRWAVNIDVAGFMDDPLGYTIPEKPNPKFKSNDPFKGKEQHSTFSIIKWIAANPLQIQYLPVTNSFEGTITSAKQIPIPPCIDTAMRHENPRHEVRLALVQHLAENLRWFAPPNTLTIKQKSDITEEIVDFISALGWRDFNQYVTRKHVRSIIDYERTPSCSWLQARGLCEGPCWRDDGTRRE
tara:strand:+ start:4052 stop:4924 length:873 start_codon:yes stop_codon:yes gene_type:complete